MIELGGNIKLTGFREIDNSSMVILKKMIGNYARKMSEKCNNFEGLEMTLKTVHDNQFEIHSKLIDNGSSKNSQVTERNIFIGVDSSLKKVLNSI